MKKYLFTFVALATASVPASAASIFSETFSGEPAGSVLNYNSYANWSVSGGTVDHIVTPGFGINCQDGVVGGKCVDMDGSTGNAGILTSNMVFNFTTGFEYHLSFYLSGNQRNGANDSVNVKFGDVDDTITLAGGAAFQQFSYFFIPLVNSMGTLSFEGLGGDNVGLILDTINVDQDVAKTGVPEPSTFLLGGGALVALGLVRRKKLAQ